MMQQKNIVLAIFISLSFLSPVLAQEKNADLLKEPANWTFERFNLPPVFAPSFPFQGFEELRFSPGMFTKGAKDYFTYAFAAAINNKSGFTRGELDLYLKEYFKGLCFNTARDRKLIVDTSKIKVNVRPESQPNIYHATLDIFGVFADGSPVTLNMEIKILGDKSAKKVYLVFIASPKPSNDEVWKQLHTISDSFSLPRLK